MKKAFILASLVLVSACVSALAVCPEQDYRNPYYSGKAYYGCPYPAYTAPGAEMVVTWEVEFSETRQFRLGVSGYRHEPYYPAYYQAYYYAPPAYYYRPPSPQAHYPAPRPAYYYRPPSYPARYYRRYPTYYYRLARAEYEQPALPKKVYTRSGVIWLNG